MTRGIYDPANAAKHPRIYVPCGFLPQCQKLKFYRSEMCIECYAVVRRKRLAEKQRKRFGK